MKFFLDENFPKAATNLLERLGHESHDARGTELEGFHDAGLVQRALELGAVIHTTDRDFFYNLRHQHPNHAGIVIIALKKSNRLAILRRFEWVLDSIPEQELPRRAFQLRDTTLVTQPPCPQAMMELKMMMKPLCDPLNAASHCATHVSRRYCRIHVYRILIRPRATSPKSAGKVP